MATSARTKGACSPRTIRSSTASGTWHASSGSAVKKTEEDMLERLEGAFPCAGHEITAKLVARGASIRELVDVVERHEPHVVVYDLSSSFDVARAHLASTLGRSEHS
jgi:hypothetical protein